MPLLETKGAASAQGFGLTLSSGAVTYIEDVFSTYLYTGNASTQTITNGIDLSTKGGLVWIKNRNSTENNVWVDTARGAGIWLSSNDPNGNSSFDSSVFTSFNVNGFTLGYNALTNLISSRTYASWTFRKQPKFFDVVTYTGNGSNRTIAHSLGSVPGCIIIKRTDTTGAWAVYHRSLANTEYLVLNTTAAKATGATYWNSTTPTSTVFSLGTATDVNANTGTYVAYLFAHDAGGFGLSGTDNVISCGSFTTDGSSNATISLGYEPQWVLLKATSAGQPWILVDQMRKLTVNSSSNVAELYPNAADAEVTAGGISPNATGFTANAQLSPSTTYIYIAIRRGPMKVPTSGTSVFSPNTISAVTGTAVTTGFPIDMAMPLLRTNVDSKNVVDRLRGVVTTSTQTLAPKLAMSDTSAEADNYYSRNWNNTGFEVPASTQNQSAIYYNFRRAPGFFDVVCYTGNGTSNSQAHNLTVAPELVLIKRRDASNNWVTLYGFGVSNYNYFLPGLNGNGASFLSSGYGSGEFVQSQPTSTQLPITSSASQTNASGGTYVAYLFATCAGVSKVGSYTGTGALQTIDCGFTGGARFVLIKRTDSTGDWYVWDSARGIVPGNDPYLLLNSTAAEVTSTDYIDTYNAGFEISSTAPAAINANGGTYIYLAIA